MSARFVLASASPARAATLSSAGIAYEVVVSDVDEEAVLEAAIAARPGLSPADQVLALARAKARAVASAHPDALVLGCDSMFEFDGHVLGKPGDTETARRRWRQMSGRSGILHTGHWLVTASPTAPRQDGRIASEPRSQAGETTSTIVHIADVSPGEIDAYVATGEPLRVAGGFTIDGLGGPFIAGLEGDHHNVVGLSLPTLRRQLRALGIAITDLWQPR